MKFIKVLGIGVLLVWGANKVLKSVVDWQKEVIAKLEKSIAYLKGELILARFTITDRKTISIMGTNINYLTVFVGFYDYKNVKINSKYFTMKGKEFNFDFDLVKDNKGNVIAFPSKIYTELMAPKNGIDISSLYVKNGFPEIYKSNKISSDSKDFIKNLYANYKSENLYSGSAVHDIPAKRFELNRSYRVILHTKGGLEVL